MNIAFVHDVFPGGGAERVTIDIARYLSFANNSYRIFIYTPVINSDMLNDKITNNFVAIREISKERSARSYDIEKWIISDGIDIVVQVVTSIRNINKIKKRTGCMVVFSNHGEPFWQQHDIIARKKSNKFKWHTYRRILYKKMKLARLRAKYHDKRYYNNCDIYTVLCEAYKKEM
jgi:glycosyltransferase involved in cell wall biosynthesis